MILARRETNSNVTHRVPSDIKNQIPDGYELIPIDKLTDEYEVVPWDQVQKVLNVTSSPVHATSAAPPTFPALGNRQGSNSQFRVQPGPHYTQGPASQKHSELVFHGGQ